MINKLAAVGVWFRHARQRLQDPETDMCFGEFSGDQQSPVVIPGVSSGDRNPRGSGRDPEKRRASRAAWEQRNPTKVAAAKRKFDKSRAFKKKTLEQRLTKRARDARARARAGMSTALHQAHVRAWEAHTRPQRLHDAHVIEFFRDKTRRYQWRYRHDIEFNLKERLRRQVRKKVDSKDRISDLIRSALKRAGESATVTAMLGWSIAELRSHLEGQLSTGESLLSLGSSGFHIDHIIPKRYFDLSTLEGVRAFWALENLRPLPAAENLRKGSRLEVDHVL